jgi:hypothetical protein
MKIFDSYAEAQEELNELNNKRASREIIFCPLLNTRCNDNCICFNEGYVSRVGEGKCVINGRGCSNAMFFGE